MIPTIKYSIIKYLFKKIIVNQGIIMRAAYRYRHKEEASFLSEKHAKIRMISVVSTVCCENVNYI